jgi:predicted nuclease with TOPRIM domain
MSQETFLRAKLELELREVQAELTRLEAERHRLARKNELLSATLYDLRTDKALSDASLQKIEEALSFDGQPWSSIHPEPESDLDSELYDEDEQSGPIAT